MGRVIGFPGRSAPPRSASRLAERDPAPSDLETELAALARTQARALEAEMQLAARQDRRLQAEHVYRWLMRALVWGFVLWLLASVFGGGA
jgi:hypothetical protein